MTEISELKLAGTIQSKLLEAAAIKVEACGEVGLRAREPVDSVGPAPEPEKPAEEPAGKSLPKQAKRRKKGCWASSKAAKARGAGRSVTRE